jgi:spore maturation protein CgeD
MLTTILTSHCKPGHCWEAIESVLAQSYSDWQLIVMDSGILYNANYFNRWGSCGKIHVATTGETEDMRKQWCMQSMAINSCFQRGLVHGDLVTFLSDDDLYEPDAFYQFAETAWHNPLQHAWYGHASLWKQVGSFSYERVGDLRADAIGGADYTDLDCKADGMQVCARRSVLDVTLWPVDIEFAGHADGVFLSMLGKRCPIHPLDFHVGSHRHTRDSTFSKSTY